MQKCRVFQDQSTNTITFVRPFVLLFTFSTISYINYITALHYKEGFFYFRHPNFQISNFILLLKIKNKNYHFVTRKNVGAYNSNKSLSGNILRSF